MLFWLRNPRQSPSTYSWCLCFIYSLHVSNFHIFSRFESEPLDADTAGKFQVNPCSTFWLIPGCALAWYGFSSASLSLWFLPFPALRFPERNSKNRIHSFILDSWNVHIVKRWKDLLCGISCPLGAYILIILAGRCDLNPVPADSQWCPSGFIILM